MTAFYTETVGAAGSNPFTAAEIAFIQGLAFDALYDPDNVVLHFATQVDTQVAYWIGANTLSGDNNLTWNYTDSLLKIGITSSLVVDTITYFSKVFSSNDDPAIVAELAIWKAGTSSGIGSIFGGARSRGTLAAPAIVSNGDEILRIDAVAFDSIDFARAAQIRISVDGVPGSDDMPGRIDFDTTPDGSNVALTRMSIINDGTVGIGTTTPNSTLEIFAIPGKQSLQFSGTTGASVNVNMSTVHAVAVAAQNCRLVPTIDPQVAIASYINMNNSMIIGGSSSNNITSIRSLAIFPRFGGSYSGTVTDGIGILISGMADQSSGTPTIDNLFGLFVDDQTLGASSNHAIQTKAGLVVFNQNGDVNSDFRVEGDTDANLFFTDASTDRVGIGTATPSTKLHVVGDATVTGKLTVGGAIDPTSLALVDAGNAAFISMAQGTSAAVSAASTGRIRYNATSQTFQISENGGAYADLSTGGSVTSVDVSGGTTGLTFSGGPITTSGTITMAGTLGVANGGTGSGSFTAGSVIFSNGTILTQDNTNFFWDDTSNFLRIPDLRSTLNLAISSGGDGGDITVTGANGTTGDGGNLTLTAGNGFTNFDGGIIDIISGFGVGTGNGGGVNITTGDGGATNGNGGDVFISTGAGVGTGLCGNIFIEAGEGFPGNAQFSGFISIASASATLTGTSGAEISIGAGSKSVTDGNGGRILISGGNVVGVNGNGGIVFIEGGDGNGTGTAGYIELFGATLGSTIVKIDSGTNLPNEDVVQNRVTTTNATVTTLHTFTIPASTTFAIESIVIARRTGGASGTAEDGARYKLSAVYKNVAGTATIIGAITKVADDDQNPWDATLTPSGGTVLLQVNGAASNSVTWHCTSRTYAVSS